MPRPLRWLLAFLVVVILLAGFAFSRMHRHANEVIERERARLDQDFAVVLARVVERSPLETWPADRPESERVRDARLVYERVLEQLASIPESELEVLPEIWPEDIDDIDEAAVEAFFATHGHLLHELEEVRHADRLSMDPALADGIEGQDFALPNLLRLRDLFAAHFRHTLAGGGDDAEALRVQRTALLTGHDFSLRGPLLRRFLGLGMQNEALGRIRILLARNRLPAEDLAGLAGDLALLVPAAARRDLEPLWSIESAMMRKLILDLVDTPDDGGRLMDLDEAGWEHLYSFRLQAADLLEAFSSLSLPFEGLDGLGWREAIDRLEVSQPQPANAEEMLRAMMLSVWPRALRLMARYAIDMHVARVAVAVARYRQDQGAWPAALDDLVPHYLKRLEPCPVAGTRLRHASGRVWSDGGDGDDDGGRPLDEDDEWDADGDRVWDLNDATIPDPFEYLR